MNLHRLSLTAPACIFLLASTLLLGGCQGDQSTTETTSPVRPVRYITLEKGTIEQTRTFTGTAVAGKRASLSFKVSGTVDTLHVSVGDLVETGDLLAELDPTDFEVEYNGAVANLKSAEADAKAAQTAVNTTRSNYNRIETLYESDNVSLSEFEQARGEFETATANLLAAQSAITTAKTKLEAAENQLNYSRLRSPFNGIINTVIIDENEEISPGGEVMSLSALASIEVVVNLSDLYIARVRRGMSTSITFPSIPGEPFIGEITEIPFAAAEAPTYPVTIRILSVDERLRPGMAARVIFRFGENDPDAGLYLPTDAVGEDSQGNFVFLIDPVDTNTGRVQKQPVTIGSLTEKGFRVVEGLEPGQLVATSGLQILMNGMDVKLLDDPVTGW